MKHRLERVRELLKRELGSVIVRDLQFAALVTISDVDITPDLKQAHVFISALGSEGQRRAAIETLESHRVALQREVSKRVVLKHTPHLNFRLDDSLGRGSRVINIMNELGLDAVPDDEDEDESND